MTGYSPGSDDTPNHARAGERSCRAASVDTRKRSQLAGAT